MIHKVTHDAVDTLKAFLRLETSGGILLAIASLLAIVLANSPASSLYEDVLGTHLTVTLGGYGVDKPLLLWVNDGLMAVFFLLVGLELKREIFEGQLSSSDQIVLPTMAALGGLLVPVAIFWALNRGDEAALSGWAIPMATDIAFALAILSLLGSRVPTALKVFLVTIAIIDDLAAIIVIAVFYTYDLGLLSLLLAGGGIIVLALLNRIGVQRLAPYLLTGLLIWLFVLKSGVHATLAGVLVAAFIPLSRGDEQSPARHLEHILHPWVAFGVLPVFAFANAGLPLGNLGLDLFADRTTLGILLGLFAGKQIGVMLMVGLAVMLGIARLPQGVGWRQVYGVALLCGVGFTMSLFIGSLAFEHGTFDQVAAAKLGVMSGSLLSAVSGWLVLRIR